MENPIKVMVEEDIHEEAGWIFLLVLAMVIGGILAAQYHSTEIVRVAYYAQSGVWFDVLCMTLVPGAFALAWIVIRVSIKMSSVGLEE